MTAIGMEEAMMKATARDEHKVKVIADDDIVDDEDEDEDELFELDIALLDGRCGDDGHRSAAAAADEEEETAGGNQHALLANCLLPVRSVSKAVPVDASGVELSPSYPYYSGYHSSRRLAVLAAGAGGMMSRRFLGWPGNSARFCFSNRSGFEAYFQRY